MRTKTTPRHSVAALERDPLLASGVGERFIGYGAMGVPFSGGHYLVLRDMLATSFDTPYRAIWHRDPSGRWTIFTTADPDVSCPRYFGAAAAVERVAAIDISWSDDWTLDVSMGSLISWRLALEPTAATRAMSSMASSMPTWSWNSNAVLASMGPMASGVLRSGRIRLRGRTPNGQAFKAAPLLVWRIVGGNAIVDDQDLGKLGPLAAQTHLEDFWLPQRGLFFVGGAAYTPDSNEQAPERRREVTKSGTSSTLLHNSE